VPSRPPAEVHRGRLRVKKHRQEDQERTLHRGLPPAIQDPTEDRLVLDLPAPCIQVLLVGAVLVILDKAQALGLALQEVPKEDHALGDLPALATLAMDIPHMDDHRRCMETVVHLDHKDHQGLVKLVQGSTDHWQALDPNAKCLLGGGSFTTFLRNRWSAHNPCSTGGSG